MKKILDHPKAALAVIIAITIFFAVQLPRVELDNNNFRFVPLSDEARVVNNDIDETFGSSTLIMVSLEKISGEIFEYEFLELLRNFVERVEEITIVGKVNSIVTSDYIMGEDDVITVTSLVPEDFSGSQEEIDEIKRRVGSWQMYERALISDDRRATQVIIPMEISIDDAGKPEVEATFLRIRDIAKEMFAHNANVYVSGIPVISATISEAMKADLAVLIPLVLIVMFTVIYLPIRRIEFVAYSLLAVVAAVIWTVGAMPFFGVRLSVISVVLPVMLIAVGNSYALHVIVHYLEDCPKDAALTKEAHTAFIKSIIAEINTPVFLATITTLVSFIAFCFTRVVPIREFGYFAAFGVFASYIIAMTLTPSILILRGPKSLGAKKRAEKAADVQSPRPKRSIADLTGFVTRKKNWILGVAVVVVIVSCFGAARLVADNILIEYFKSTTEIARSDAFIRQKFGGSKVINIVVRGETSDDVLHPDTLGALEGLGSHLNTLAETGKVMGFNDLIKRINSVYNEDPSYYEIPQDPARYNKKTRDELTRVIAGYLVLLSGDIAEYADDPLEPVSIRTIVQLRTKGSIDTERVVREIHAYARENFPQNVSITVGGTALVENSINNLVVRSVWVSMIIAFCALFIIVSVINRSPIAGLIGLVPLLALILLNFAVMGFGHIKLNLGTAIIFSLAMGIGIDYTIHFMEAYKREYRKAQKEGAPAGDYAFLRRAFNTSGLAVLADAASTGAGFAVLIFSRFTMLADFGLLTALSIFMSAVVGLVVIPALFLKFKPKFIEQVE